MTVRNIYVFETMALFPLIESFQKRSKCFKMEGQMEPLSIHTSIYEIMGSRCCQSLIGFEQVAVTISHGLGIKRSDDC